MKMLRKIEGKANEHRKNTPDSSDTQREREGGREAERAEQAKGGKAFELNLT